MFTSFRSSTQTQLGTHGAQVRLVARILLVFLSFFLQTASRLSAGRKRGGPLSVAHGRAAAALSEAFRNERPIHPVGGPGLHSEAPLQFHRYPASYLPPGAGRKPFFSSQPGEGFPRGGISFTRPTRVHPNIGRTHRLRNEIRPNLVAVVYVHYSCRDAWRRLVGEAATLVALHAHQGSPRSTTFNPTRLPG